MGLTIDLESEASVELDDVDVTVSNDCIAFSIDGKITDIPPKILEKYRGEGLSPAEISFKEE